MRRSHGFTVIELLIALAIVLSIAGLLAQVVEPARLAFERVPAELDLHQRGRTVIDVIARAVRSTDTDVAATTGLGAFADLLPVVALTDPDGAGGRYSTLTVMAPVANAAQGTLEIDQAAPAAALTLATTACPDVKEVCGFHPGTTAVIMDDAGHYDVFIVASTLAASRTLTADRAFSHVYPAGSAVIEIDRHTFALAVQGDGSYSLLRSTAAGAAQPVVDHIAELSFQTSGHSVDVVVTVEAATEPLRRVIRNRSFRTSIKWRNAS